MLIPNGTDDTEQIKNALDYNTNEPKAVELGPGRFHYFGDYAPIANKKLTGVSENQGTTIVFHGGGITMDGNVRGANGWSFQNIISDMMFENDIDGVDTFLKIGKGYNNRFENVWFHKINSLKMAKIYGSNNTIFNNVRFWGTGQKYGLDISSGSMIMNQVNIEGFTRDGTKGGAFNYRGGVVTATGLYIERSSIPICLDNGVGVDGQLTITGGFVRGLNNEVEVSIRESHNVLIQGLSLENMETNHKVYVYYDGNDTLKEVRLVGIPESSVHGNISAITIG